MSQESLVSDEEVEVASTTNKSRFSSGFSGTEKAFTWEIKNFKLVQAADPKVIEKEHILFTIDAKVGGDTEKTVVTKWKVSLRVVKVNRKGDYIGIYAQLVNKPPVPVFGVFDVRLPTKEDRCYFHKVSDLNMDEGPWGFSTFIRKVSLPYEVLPLVDDSLIIEGKIKVVIRSPVGDGSFTEYDARKRATAKMKRDLNEIWEKRSAPGAVTLVSMFGDEHLSNKIILAARSPVFAAMFSSGMAESQSDTVTISDASAKSVDTMLDYIHAGKFFKDATCEELVDVAYLAEKYDLSELHEFVDQLLVTSWDMARAAEMLETVDRLNLKVTKERIEDFMGTFLLRPKKEEDSSSPKRRKVTSGKKSKSL